MAEGQAIAAQVRLRYRRAGVLSGWSRERFNRLCRLLNLTQVEMGAMCAISPQEVARGIKYNRFTPPVSLHLSIIEAAFLELKFGKKWKPIIPLDLIKL